MILSEPLLVEQPQKEAHISYRQIMHYTAEAKPNQ